MFSVEELVDVCPLLCETMLGALRTRLVLLKVMLRPVVGVSSSRYRPSQEQPIGLTYISNCAMGSWWELFRSSRFLDLLLTL